MASTIARKMTGIKAGEISMGLLGGKLGIALGLLIQYFEEFPSGLDHQAGARV